VRTYVMSYCICATEFSVDATMKVSLDVLRRVYDSLQDRGERTHVERELIDPENHLFFIDAYEMPRWVWSQERGTFERYFNICPPDDSVL
jgi:hypothetical protein